MLWEHWPDVLGSVRIFLPPEVQNWEWKWGWNRLVEGIESSPKFHVQHQNAVGMDDQMFVCHT